MSEKIILAADGDPAFLQALQQSLEKGGFSVVVARTVQEAMAQVQVRRTADFSAVVVDYQLPREGSSSAVEAGGVDLLRWLKGLDSTLEVVVTGCQSDPVAIRAALHGGAMDFWAKPILPAKLLEAMNAIGERTTNLRRGEMARKDIHALSEMNYFFRAILDDTVAVRLQVHHMPHDQIGGDFVNVLPLGDGKPLLIVGDVSGHDLRAGFVSTYFQGLVRGLCHSYGRRTVRCAQKNFCALAGSAAVGICENFNKILVEEWERRSNSVLPIAKGKGAFGSNTDMTFAPRTTLALLAVELDLKNNTATVVNCGAPALRLRNKNGGETVIRSMNPPLGWSDDEPIESRTIELAKVAEVVLATDGFYDWAERLGISPRELEMVLLEEHRLPGGAPPDDSLVLRYRAGDEKK